MVLYARHNYSGENVSTNLDATYEEAIGGIAKWIWSMTRIVDCAEEPKLDEFYITFSNNQPVSMKVIHDILGCVFE